MLLPAVVLSVAMRSVPAISAFDDAFQKVHDYTVTIHEFEAEGDSRQDRTYRLWFKQPNSLKAEITAGDGKGNGAVWNGGDTVKGRESGILSFIHLKLGLHDPRVTTLRGYTIAQAAIQNQVAKFTQIKGDLTERPGPIIDGVPTDAVDLKYANPASQGGATRATMYFSATTHLPLRMIQYEGDNVVDDESFIDLRTNLGLDNSDFSL
jgi:outer membrane lipoprotein-sorting protein